MAQRRVDTCLHQSRGVTIAIRLPISSKFLREKRPESCSWLAHKLREWWWSHLRGPVSLQLYFTFNWGLKKKTLHKPYVHTIFIDQNKNSSKLSRTANKCHEGNQSDVSYFHQKFPTRQRGQAPVSSRLHCKLPSVPKLSFQLTRVANFRKWISKVQSEKRGLYQLLVIHW